MAECGLDAIVGRLEVAGPGWIDHGTPSFPIERSDIRRWAIAVHWPEPPPRLYWDEDHARRTRWGGIIAPPDFNPFAWPVPPAAATRMPYHAVDGDPPTAMLNGGQSLRFLRPMRPGDVIRSRQRVVSFSERDGRLGRMLYIDVERELRNQQDELVRVAMDVVILY